MKNDQLLMNCIKVKICVFAFFLVSISASLAQIERFSTDDLAKIVTLRDPQISPDGKNIVMVVSRQDLEENKHINELVLVSVSSGESRVLTYNRPKVSNPRWSADGDSLAFLSIGKEGKNQIFIMTFKGGDPREITSHSNGVRAFYWSPDGQNIVFLAKDKLDEKEGIQKNNKSFEVGDFSFLAKEPELPSHLWLISAKGGDESRLTSGEHGISDSIDWAPDSQSIAFVHETSTLDRYIKIIDIETKGITDINSGTTAYLSPGFSPDGSTISYTRHLNYFYPRTLYEKNLETGSEIVKSVGLDRDVSGYWMPDGTSMLLDGVDLTRSVIWHKEEGTEAIKLDLGNIDVYSATSIADDGSLTFIGVEPNAPRELYYMPSVMGKPQKLTDFNSDIAALNYGKVETIVWQGPDGFEQNGVLVFPPDYDKTKKYPLVLSIHGGPMGTSIVGFSANNRAMAANDWIVFSPNYRGSSNMGYDFQSAVINDAGDGPGRDVMSGVEAVKNKYAIDEDRLAVSGWSYGGYMTVWLTAHYDVWKVAVAGAPVTDWFDWYSLADMNIWSGQGLGGSPYLNDNADAYWDQSPIKYAHQIKAPTLILSDVEDQRVTVTQSYKLYHALKDNDVEVKFIAYPVYGHFPSDPIHAQDVTVRWIEWIKDHFD